MKFEFYEVRFRDCGIADDFSSMFKTKWEAMAARDARFKELLRWQREGNHREGLHKLYLIEYKGKEWMEIGCSITVDLNRY